MSSAYYERLVDIEIERQREYQATRDHYAPELVTLREAIADAKASTSRDKDSRLAAAHEALARARAEFESSLTPAREAYEERTSGAPAELLSELRALRNARKNVPRGKDQAGRARAKAERTRLDQEIACLSQRKRSFAPPSTTKGRLNARVLEEMLDEQWPEAWKDLAQAEASANDQIRAARGSSGLTKGCYLRIEAAVTQAIGACAREGKALGRKQRETDRWQIAVQLTPPLTWREVELGRDTRLRVLVGGERRNPRAKRNGTVMIRVGSNDDRSPIWATFPVRLHRTPPPSAIVKWAWILVQKYGGKFRYDFQISSEDEAYKRTPPETGTVEVELVEERRGADWVVARWRGDDDETGELRLSGHLCSRLGYGDSIRATRERLQVRAWRVLRLLRRRAGEPVSGVFVRNREEEIVTQAHAWYEEALGGREKSDALWCRWREQRQLAGLDLYASPAEAMRASRGYGLAAPGERLAFWLQLWTRKNNHLARFAEHVSRGARKARDEQFRLLAARLSRRYRVLEIGNEVLVPHDDKAGKLRRVLGTGRLREVLKEAFTEEFTITARKAENIIDSSTQAQQMSSLEVRRAV